MLLSFLALRSSLQPWDLKLPLLQRHHTLQREARRGGGDPGQRSQRSSLQHLLGRDSFGVQGSAQSLTFAFLRAEVQES